MREKCALSCGAKPVAEPVPPAPVATEPVAEPAAAALAAEPVAEPVAGTVAEPAAEPVAETAAETVTEPVAKPISEPLAAHRTQSTEETSTPQDDGVFPDEALLPLSIESPSRDPDSSQPASLPTVEAGRAVSQEAGSVSTPEDAMAKLGMQVGGPSSPERAYATGIYNGPPSESLSESYRPPAPTGWVPEGSLVEAEGEATDDPWVLAEIIDDEPEDGPDDAVASTEQLQARLHRCRKLAENRVTEARKSNFDELNDSHKKDVDEALFKQKRELWEQMERVKRDFRRKEVEMNAHVQEAIRRQEEAEHRLRHIDSGDHYRQALERSRALEKSLADEEQSRLQLEKQIREKMDLAAAREQKLQEDLEAMKARAEPAERTVARLRRQLWLRRRQLIKKTPPSHLDGNKSALDDSAPVDFGTQCMMDGAVSVGKGICKKAPKAREPREQEADALPEPEMLAFKLRESAMGAMQILSPVQDMAIWHMHSDLCLAQARGTYDPCVASKLFNASSWMAAFAWVALWRCVWVLSIRYFMSCCIRLAMPLLPVWDFFSDWFCGFRRKQELVKTDF